MRRTIAVLVLVLVAALGGAPTTPSAEAQLEPPNILVIVTDDQRAGLSVMPATRRYFRRQGVRYAPGFVTTPVCCPSRASIMTGQYAHNHGVKANRGPEEDGAEKLDHATTLQARLQSNGYHTGLLGKFLNGWPLADNPPFFDEWVMVGGVGESDSADDWSDLVYNLNGAAKRLPGYSNVVLKRRAAGFIRRNSGAPWYLYISTKGPHLPAYPQRKYADLPVGEWRGNPAVFERNRRDKPPYVKERRIPKFRTLNQIRRRQLRTLPSIDDLVEKVFAELQATGDLDNTLAFFISDNGFMWGEHGRVGKDVPYRQAVMVPFLARWPGHLPAGVDDDRFAANIDIAPTVLDATGIPVVAPADGRSLLDGWRRDRIHLEHWCNIGNTGRCNRWASTWTRSTQYTEYFERDGTITFREYYDLEEDPWQLENLLGNRDADDDPDTADAEAQLGADRECVGTTCP